MVNVGLFSGEGTEHNLLRAALETFSAYGFKRTSLDEIARQANVSRPTIYTYFKNKEDILRAVSQGIHDATLSAIDEALNSEQDLSRRLTEAFWAWSKPFMGILFGSRHGAELIGAGSAIAADISINARDRFCALLAETLRRAHQNKNIDLTRGSLTVEDAAEYLVLSLNGLSSGEADEQTYRKRLNTLVRVFLTAVRPE
ncbi:MAG: TetR/AcrR family transcriptional regulator [Pseudomonadota bacterium]